MTIEGYVEQVRYYNEENGYSVIDFVTQEEMLTCCGFLPDLKEGERLKLNGENTFHPTYGPQFKVSSFEITGLNDAYAVERYLASGAIKGIGPVTAAKIVERFGDDTLKILEEEPERLAEIKGISEAKARDIAVQLEGQTALRAAMLFMQQYGISVKTATKIYQHYKEDVYEIIRTNPYRLAVDVDGIGFITADEIAMRVGLAKDFEFRIKSGLLFCLNQAAGDGHTYLPYDVFLSKSAALLGLRQEALMKSFDDLSFDGELVLKKLDGIVRVYLKKLFTLEKEIARMLMLLSEPIKFNEASVLKIIKKEAERENLILEETQVNAVLQSAREGFSVITGGPGTGKTTIIKLLIKCFNNQGMDVMLAAPTGRAAKRMAEATGYEAKTIHRMLEISAVDDDNSENYFARNEDYPLETDVVIIDEMSMVDVYLMHSLLKAVMQGTRLVLVGDMNQLPSVGPGSVLKDIVNSRVFPVMELTHIFRQAAKSDIVTNAHKIKEGAHIKTDNKSEDFYFLERKQAEVVMEAVKYLVTKKLPSYVGTVPMEIQVITPTRKGVLGVEELNKMLQAALNPASSKKREHSFGNILFREGDKVMQIKNNYQLEWQVYNSRHVMTDHGSGVFNGDIGFIKSIDPILRLVKVVFDNVREVTYDYVQMDELEPAYAITVHKSQGSEYPAIVMPLLAAPRILLTRNLLYTAVTRAKKCVTIVGDSDILFGMINNPSEMKRYSGLCDCIKEAGKSGERMNNA